MLYFLYYRKCIDIVCLVSICLFMTATGLAGDFLRLHPENPRYFEFRGKPQVLITATEHYGAVLNLDFDYITYLDMLRDKEFNLTRTFVFYREPQQDFEGKMGYQNTLAPRPGRWCAPWQRSETPGAKDGGNKFDLDRWNKAYFERLKDFCIEAGKRDIIVEIVLFSQYYEPRLQFRWALSPLKASNNINGVGNIKGRKFTTLQDDAVVERQTALVRKVVDTLRDMDNVYYEICNEPNWTVFRSPDTGHMHYLTFDWHQYLVDVIRDVESTYSNQHLIAVNCNGFTEELVRALKGVSVRNFHYHGAAMPALTRYLDLERPIAFDETLSGVIHWNPSLDFNARRKEAWQFLLRGGSVYDYLDVTIATDDETGTGQVAFPGGLHYHGEIMRLYLHYLVKFFQELDFIHMQPDQSVPTTVPKGARIAMLANPGVVYAAYIAGAPDEAIGLRLPEGQYTATWYDPCHGTWKPVGQTLTGDATVTLTIPAYLGDAALLVRRNRSGK